MNLSGAHGAYGQDDHAEWLPMKRKTNHVNRPADNARSTIRCFCSSSELAGKAASSQDLQETFMKHVWQWLPGHASQDETGETCPRAQGSLLILSKSGCRQAVKHIAARTTLATQAITKTTMCMSNVSTKMLNMQITSHDANSTCRL